MNKKREGVKFVPSLSIDEIENQVTHPIKTSQSTTNRNYTKDTLPLLSVKSSSRRRIEIPMPTHSTLQQKIKTRFIKFGTRALGSSRFNDESANSVLNHFITNVLINVDIKEGYALFLQQIEFLNNAKISLQDARTAIVQGEKISMMKNMDDVSNLCFMLQLYSLSAEIILSYIKILRFFPEISKCLSLCRRLRYVCQIVFAYDYEIKVQEIIAKCYQEEGQYQRSLQECHKMLMISLCKKDFASELKAYDLIGKQYFYLNDLVKAKFFHNRMMNGIIEPIGSNLRNGSKNSIKKRELWFKNSVGRNLGQIEVEDFDSGIENIVFNEKDSYRGNDLKDKNKEKNTIQLHLSKKNTVLPKKEKMVREVIPLFVKKTIQTKDNKKVNIGKVKRYDFKYHFDFKFMYNSSNDRNKENNEVTCLGHLSPNRNMGPYNELTHKILENKGNSKGDFYEMFLNETNLRKVLKLIVSSIYDIDLFLEFMMPPGKSLESFETLLEGFRQKTSNNQQASNN